MDERYGKGHDDQPEEERRDAAGLQERFVRQVGLHDPLVHVIGDDRRDHVVDRAEGRHRGSQHGSDEDAYQAVRKQLEHESDEHEVLRVLTDVRLEEIHLREVRPVYFRHQRRYPEHQRDGKSQQRRKPPHALRAFLVLDGVEPLGPSRREPDARNDKY